MTLHFEGVLLDKEATQQSTDEYVLLRKVEHYLQILENRQIHSLSTDPAELDALAERALDVAGDHDGFLTAIHASLERVPQAVRVVLATNPEYSRSGGSPAFSLDTMM